MHNERGRCDMMQEEYLRYVLGKLECALTELEEKMKFRRSEIARMQEYYWESYTEYDEFGYEKFDNNRLLKEETFQKNKSKKQYFFHVSPPYSSCLFQLRYSYLLRPMKHQNQIPCLNLLT